MFRDKIYPVVPPPIVPQQNSSRIVTRPLPPIEAMPSIEQKTFEVIQQEKQDEMAQDTVLNRNKKKRVEHPPEKRSSKKRKSEMPNSTSSAAVQIPLAVIAEIQEEKKDPVAVQEEFKQNIQALLEVSGVSKQESVVAAINLAQPANNENAAQITALQSQLNDLARKFSEITRQSDELTRLQEENKKNIDEQIKSIVSSSVNTNAVDASQITKLMQEADNKLDNKITQNAESLHEVLSKINEIVQKINNISNDHVTLRDNAITQATMIDNTFKDLGLVLSTSFGETQKILNKMQMNLEEKVQGYDNYITTLPTNITKRFTELRTEMNTDIDAKITQMQNTLNSHNNEQMGQIKKEIIEGVKQYIAALPIPTAEKTVIIEKHFTVTNDNSTSVQELQNQINNLAATLQGKADVTRLEAISNSLNEYDDTELRERINQLIVTVNQHNNNMDAVEEAIMKREQKVNNEFQRIRDDISQMREQKADSDRNIPNPPPNPGPIPGPNGARGVAFAGPPPVGVRLPIIPPMMNAEVPIFGLQKPPLDNLKPTNDSLPTKLDMELSSWADEQNVANRNQDDIIHKLQVELEHQNVPERYRDMYIYRMIQSEPSQERQTYVQPLRSTMKDYDNPGSMPMMTCNDRVMNNQQYQNRVTRVTMLNRSKHVDDVPPKRAWLIGKSGATSLDNENNPYIH